MVTIVSLFAALVALLRAHFYRLKSSTQISSSIFEALQRVHRNRALYHTHLHGVWHRKLSVLVTHDFAGVPLKRPVLIAR
jgi:hypothetical protein